MSDLVWWTIFSVLTLILTVIVTKLLYRVINDVWCKDDNVYSEDQRDIEDLTRYKTDFRTIFKDAQVQDESDRLMMKKDFVGAFRSENEMKVIQEEDENRSDWKKIYGDRNQTKEVKEEVKEEEKPDENEHQNREDPKEASQDQVDAGEKVEDEFTLEEREVLERILGIEGETKIYAKQIPFCLGGKNHLTYFEFNEKFLRNLIGLSDIDCKNNDTLKKRKEMVSLYIQECQDELKKKAEASI